MQRSLVGSEMCIRDSGTMVPRYHGTMVPWYHGTIVPWYHGTMVPWYPGTMVSWYHGTMAMVPGSARFQFNTVRHKSGSGSCPVHGSSWFFPTRFRFMPVRFRRPVQPVQVPSRVGFRFPGQFPSFMNKRRPPPGLSKGCLDQHWWAMNLWLGGAEFSPLSERDV